MSGTIGDARKRLEGFVPSPADLAEIRSQPIPAFTESMARALATPNPLVALAEAAEVCKAAGYQVLKFGGLTSMEREEIDALKVAEL